MKRTINNRKIIKRLNRYQKFNYRINQQQEIKSRNLDKKQSNHSKENKCIMSDRIVLINPLISRQCHQILKTRHQKLRKKWVNPVKNQNRKNRIRTEVKDKEIQIVAKDLIHSQTRITIFRL